MEKKGKIETEIDRRHVNFDFVKFVNLFNFVIYSVWCSRIIILIKMLYTKHLFVRVIQPIRCACADWQEIRNLK